MRELQWRAEGKARHDWGQTALIAALLYNANRSERAPVKTVEDFNPYTAGRPREPDFVLDGKQGMKLLKKVFGAG